MGKNNMQCMEKFNFFPKKIDTALTNFFEINYVPSGRVLLAKFTIIDVLSRLSEIISRRKHHLWLMVDRACR